MTEHKETEELPFLIEGYQKEIWEWKQKESQWLEDRVMLDGTKKLVEQLSGELVRMKKRAQEAEGETTIVKSIGINSPEMKALQKQKEILQAACRRAGAEIKSLKDTIVKLEQRVEDVLNPLRKDGLL